jgi:hypothetical protein
LQMERPFSEFFAKVEAKPLSEIQIIGFKKHSCRETGTPGYYCSFSYSMKPTAARFSVLPADGTLSGMFFSDGEGQFRFEMVIG